MTETDADCRTLELARQGALADAALHVLDTGDALVSVLRSVLLAQGVPGSQCLRDLHGRWRSASLDLLNALDRELGD